MPQTLCQGVASGIGHPVIGLDHLAFLLAAPGDGRSGEFCEAWVFGVGVDRLEKITFRFSI